MWRWLKQLAIRPLTLRTRVPLFLAGVALPVICFLLAAGPFPFQGEWQSGNLHDYLCYLLGIEAGWVFYPFLAYAIACLLLTLIRDDFNERFWVRLGIFTAPVVAVPYAFLLCIAVGEFDSFNWALIAAVSIWGIFACAAGLVAWFAIRFAVPWMFWLLRRLRWNWTTAVAAVLLLSATGGLVVLDIANNRGQVFEAILYSPLILIFFSLAAAPYWALLVYSFMSVRIYLTARRAIRFTLLQIMALMTWLAAYLGAWRWGMQLALDEYSRLPLEPPDNCYICTAAARGHGRWVGSWDVATAGGALRINQQMRNLKAFEVALQTAWPAGHRRLRCVYDCAGPRLAQQLRHPLAADIAYLALKPVEWTASAAFGLARLRIPCGIYGTADAQS